MIRRRDLAGPSDNGGGPARRRESFKHEFIYAAGLSFGPYRVCGFCGLQEPNQVHDYEPPQYRDYTDPEADRD